MSFLGMGTLEILVVLLLAFILLGPNRMVDAARWMGTALKEVRRLTENLPEIALDEQPFDLFGRAAKSRDNSSAGSSTNDAENGSPDDSGGPVAFRKPGASSNQDENGVTRSPRGDEK